MDGGLLSLRWNDHGQTFFSMLSSVRKRGAYTDVTLACDGRFYPAHRLVLSTCSDFFDQMFERTTCKHPVIVVANVGYGDLEALLNYMYLGEINVLQGDLSALMKAAEALRIKGLAEPTSSAASEPELKEGKRLHEDEVVGNKRKKMEEVPPMRQLAISKPAISKPATSKPATSKPAMSKPVTSNAEGTPCNQLDSSSRSRPNSQAPVGGGWPRIKGGVRPSEPPASSTGEQSKQMTPETDTASALYNTDQDHTPNPPSPEMKMEEVSVKDEPTSWYSENDSEPVKYPDSNTNLEYGSGDTSAAVDYQGGGGGSAAWNVLQTQLESHLLHGQPGTSTMTGDMIGMVARAGQNFEEQRQRYRRYEATGRSRKFVESWKLEFTWVTYNTNMRVMTCTTCLQFGREEDKTSSFVSGNSNFKRLSLVRHQDSQIHQRCEARRMADLATNP